MENKVTLAVSQIGMLNCQGILDPKHNELGTGLVILAAIWNISVIAYNPYTQRNNLFPAKVIWVNSESSNQFMQNLSRESLS